MKRKIRTTLLIVFCCLLGFVVNVWVDLSLNLMCHLKGYVAYCSAKRLPNIFFIIQLEITIMMVLSCIFIYSENYSLSKGFLKSILIGYTVNLAFMTYKIMEYPLLIKVSSTWNSRLLSKSDLIHPLLYVSIFSALLLGVLLLRNGEKIDKTTRKGVYGITSILLLAELISIWSVTYEHCFG